MLISAYIRIFDTQITFSQFFEARCLIHNTLQLKLLMNLIIDNEINDEDIYGYSRESKKSLNFKMQYC